MTATDSITLNLTAVIRKEDDGYFSICPELSVASQGDTVEEAKAMLKEALEGWFECADLEEFEYLVDGQSKVLPVCVTASTAARGSSTHDEANNVVDVTVG